MDLSPGAQGNAGGQVEFQLSQKRISTLLSAPSNQSSRPQSQIQQNGNSGGAQSPVVVNALPEGLNIEELLEDIKKLKATVRKQGRRIAKLEQAKENPANVSSPSPSSTSTLFFSSQQQESTKKIRKVYTTHKTHTPRYICTTKGRRAPFMFFEITQCVPKPTIRQKRALTARRFRRKTCHLLLIFGG